jgi:K+-transporting ATPase A subunit
MTTNGGMQIAVFLALILAISKPLGVFMARVFSRERTFLDPVARPSLLPCRRRWPFTPPRLSRPTPIGNYSGESTRSDLTQMAGLAYQFTKGVVHCTSDTFPLRNVTLRSL